MDDWRLRVCLERSVDLAGPSLRLRDWPGLGGPLVHVPDPLSADDDATLIGLLASTLASRYRVVSVIGRGGGPYQVDAADLLATLDQFGFASPVLLGERLGCVAALLLAAWHPRRVAGLALVEPAYEAPSSAGAAVPGDAAGSARDGSAGLAVPGAAAWGGLAARALRDCPPNWTALRKAVECPVVVVPQASELPAALEPFLAQLEPGLT